MSDHVQGGSEEEQEEEDQPPTSSVSTSDIRFAGLAPPMILMTVFLL